MARLNQDKLKRYLQLLVLVVGSGSVFPLVYLRQNFEVSLLEALGINAEQLGQCYALLGVMFTLTYLPSGWLADRFPARWLISLSLLATALLGLWFASYPDFNALRLIFIGWGLSTGLCLWAALIKGVALLAHSDEQGRFFGILDGGRGLVEAILASLAVALFAYLLQSDTTVDASLQTVIYCYVGLMFLVAPVILFTLGDNTSEEKKTAQPKPNLWADCRVVLSNGRLWLAGLCLMCGYQLFWATYSFSAYLQNSFGLTAVTVGTITVAKLWMRPFGAITAGFVGDRYNCELVLCILMVLAAIALLGIVVMPARAATLLLLTMVLVIGFLTYAVRGLYWSTLDACKVPARIKGLAIGLMSMVGYSPDIYLPLLNGYLLTQFPGRTGYAAYFTIIAAVGLLGAVAAWRLYQLQITDRNET